MDVLKKFAAYYKPYKKFFFLDLWIWPFPRF